MNCEFVRVSTNLLSLFVYLYAKVSRLVSSSFCSDIEVINQHLGHRHHLHFHYYFRATSDNNYITPLALVIDLYYYKRVVHIRTVSRYGRCVCENVVRDLTLMNM